MLYNEPMLTYESAAAYLGITMRTLRTWVKKGRIPAHRFNSTRRVYFFKSEIDNAVAGQDSNFPGY